MEHSDHLVQWKRSGGEYALYCFTCGGFTRQATTKPNHQNMQKYQEATANPEEISVTLEVQNTKHKTRNFFHG